MKVFLFIHNSGKTKLGFSDDLVDRNICSYPECYVVTRNKQRADRLIFPPEDDVDLKVEFRNLAKFVEKSYLMQLF